jgi:hypothetical protein
MRGPGGKNVFARAPGVFGVDAEGYRGWWPKNVLIPRAAGEDFFTSRMVHDWRVFPYGRNIAAVVSAVMDKDCQGAAQKRQAVVRLHEARPKRPRGTAKAAAPGGTKSVKAAPVSSRASEAAKAARELPPPGKRVADFTTDISVEDYLVGKSLARVFLYFFNLLIRRRVGRRPTCCCSAYCGDRGGCRGAQGEG